jgi:hypothetical protein
MEVAEFNVGQWKGIDYSLQFLKRYSSPALIVVFSRE